MNPNEHLSKMVSLVIDILMATAAVYLFLMVVVWIMEDV